MPTQRKPSRPDRTPAAATNTGASLHIHQGLQLPFLGDAPIVPLFADLTATDNAGRVSGLKTAGINAFRLLRVGLGWNAPNKFDYTEIDARLDALRLSAPDAPFLLQVVVDAPRWWRVQYSKECVGYAQSIEEADFVPAASWASTQWRHETGDALNRLIRHVLRSVMGANCLGVEVAAGVGGYWECDHAGQMPDNGPRMTEAFRTFALAKYRRNAGLLRKNWFDARAEFDSIICPSPYDRRKTDYGAFRNPQRSRKVLDYYETYYTEQNDAALYFCEIVKRASEDKLLAGLSYGPTLGTPITPSGGHAYPEAVYDSPLVNFLVAPAPAMLHGPSLPAGSAALRGKLMLYQLSSEAASSLPVSLAHHSGLTLGPDTPMDAAGQIAPMMKRMTAAPSKGRKRVSQVAIFLDPASLLYIGGISPIANLLLTEQMAELTRLGAPFDIYLQSDLFHPKLPDYKVMVFLDSFYLSEAERRRLDARVKRSGQTAVWFWGGGMIGEEGVSAEYGLRCTGQKTRIETGEISLRVRIANSDDVLTWGWHMGATWGAEQAVAPVLTIADKTAVRLGANSANKTVFSARRYETWRSVVFGGLTVPARLLRNVLREAGCHLYSEAEGVSIQADSRLLAVRADKAGTVKVFLPGLHTVMDGATGQAVATSVTEFSAVLTANPTGAVGLYELRPIETKPVRHD